MTGLARADLLRPVWAQAAVLSLAAVGFVTVAFVPVPWWGKLVAAVALCWLVASYVYVHASILTGRMIAPSVVATAVVIAWCPGWWKLLAIAVPIAGIAIPAWLRIRGTLQPDAISGDRTSVPEFQDQGNRLVDAIDTIWGSTRPGGPRYGLRSAHPHGSMAEGVWRSSNRDPNVDVELFEPDSGGRATVRFSNFKGEPARDDGNRTPHGLAVRLEGGGAGTLDLVLVDIRRFPAATREDFVTLTRAFATKGLVRVWNVARMIFGGRSSLIAFGGFAFASRPTSYVTRTYHGLNAFYWALDKDENAEPIPVRYVATPVDAGARWDQAAVPSRSALDNDLRARLAAKQPVVFDVHLVLGQSRRGRRFGRHRIDNALRRWPQSNQRPLCRIKLERYISEDDIRVRFDPLDLPHGITPSDDEILLARRASYPASYLRRVSASKVPL